MCRRNDNSSQRQPVENGKLAWEGIVGGSLSDSDYLEICQNLGRLYDVLSGWVDEKPESHSDAA